MRLKHSLLYLMLGILLLGSCNSIDKQEKIPAYIRIDKIELQVNSNGSQGSNAHDIQDAWILANGELIGVFELPCVVPILKSDSTEIIVFAGIKMNGQSNNRVFYPFYDIYRQKVNLIAGEVLTLNPVIGYKPEVVFPWVEDFEDFNVSLQKSGITRTIDTMSITGDPTEVFSYGQTGNRYSGKVDFRSQIGTFENSSIDLFDLPRGSSDIYLEVNYKSDVAIQFGMYPTTGSSFDVGVPIYIGFASPTVWKKAYIRLAQEVNNPQYAGKKFRIFINAIHTEAKPAKILLDNIKIVHF